MHTRQGAAEPAQPQNTPTRPALPLTEYANTLAGLISLTTPPAAQSPLIVDGRFGRAVIQAAYSAQILKADGSVAVQVAGETSALDALVSLYRNLPIYRVYSIERKIQILAQRSAAAFSDLLAAQSEAR